MSANTDPEFHRQFQLPPHHYVHPMSTTPNPIDASTAPALRRGEAGRVDRTLTAPTIASVIGRLEYIHSELWGQDVRIPNEITKCIYMLTEIEERCAIDKGASEVTLGVTSQAMREVT